MADILFLMRIPKDGKDNLCAKFYGQMASARRLGHNAHWIAWDAAGMWLCGDGEPRLLHRARLSGMPAYHHTMLYVDLMTALKKLAKQRAYDAVYMRYMPTFWNAPSALRAMKARGAKLIVEHPTYPFRHARSTSWLRKPFFWYTEQVFSRIHPMVDLYAVMGDDCGGQLDGRPAVNILNGVDVESLPLHDAPATTDEVHLLALASMSCWQGYDRLIRSMAAWQGREKVVLHLAGTEGDGSLAAWLKLAEELQLGDRVRFEGELHGEELDALVAQCDAGVGSLAIYKRRVKNVITLKLREYMARGLPFIYAVETADEPWESAFCLQVANDDSAIDMADVISFIKRVRADETLSVRMRTYAKQHMSWEPIIKTVLEGAGIR
ncbi:MAG: glycosyltransferase [Clostridia bacterium]|nr:glycosyltransferase [Clostridia bacterium]